MIKSFHHMSPRTLHSYVVLSEVGRGVEVQFTREDGTRPGNNVILTIDEEGVQLWSGLDGEEFGIKNEDGKSRVRAFDRKGDVLMTQQEWLEKYPRNKCTNRYHQWLLHDQAMHKCDICSQELLGLSS